ncbi:sugar transferase [Halalkalibacter alkalisediminis]|uniref:Sugar transferase n=1 Tax=Halalkalibacter alkalisediminis TaxID=935616 RepID=A0ABV6NJA2_9BACI|nr:sugar transferase [Halalkalibacter alkalisediminis]
MLNQKVGIYRRFVKRPMDFTLALIAILALSPVLLIVAVLVRSKLGSPILFKQERPGLNEKIFTMYKFRTMTDERDENGELLPNEMRHTNFGRFLRSTSLDELPELINVLKGDMSLVGPRPLLVDYLLLYNEEQSHRHDVRPGITGYAQVNGRNAISWEAKFKKDIYYINNLSFSLDIKILIQTVVKVFKKENVNLNEKVTMERFKGTIE